MKIRLGGVGLVAGSLLLAVVMLATLYSPWDADGTVTGRRAERTDHTVQRASTMGPVDESKPPDEGTDFNCEGDLSQVASSSLVLAEQLPRRIRAYMGTLATQGLDDLELALVAEAAGQRCITASCYRHVPLGEVGRLLPLEETYSLPVRTVGRGAGVEQARDLRTVAEAVAADLSTLDFVLLLDDLRPDLNATWRDSRTRRPVNLAMFAALRLRASHLEALIERGASPVLEEDSVLDAIALKVPVPALRSDALVDTVKQLVQAGDRAFLPSTLKRFEKFVPVDLALSIHPRTQLALAAGDLSMASDELSQLVASWQHEIDDAVRLERRCAKLGREAADHTSLAAKKRYEEVRSKRTQMLLADSRKAQREYRSRSEARNDEAATALDKGMEAVSAAIDEDRWSDALALADEWYPATGVADLFYQSLLTRALRHGAPATVVGELAERLGGVLPPSAIMELLERWPPDDILATILELEASYGLDLHYVDDEGHNAMSILARRFTGMPEFSELDAPFLLLANQLGERGVTAKPHAVGFDPLDIVLSALLRQPRSSRQRAVFVRALLAAGAPLERSHFELVGQLADLDLDAYRRFVALVPELATPG